jgi:uncharacterized protein with GYD domain
MIVRSLILGSVLAALLTVSAMAEHRYLTLFKYNDAAVKAMTENPQDRSAQIAKLAESFGGKMEAAYWFGAGGEYDGMVIQTFPDEITGQAQNLFVRAAGNLFQDANLAAPDCRRVQGGDGQGKECEEQLHGTHPN